MTKTDVNILTEFKDSLNKCTTPYLGAMYHHLFSILSDEELTELLTYHQSVYNEDKEGWFYQFHKSIRQCDFFGNDLLSYRTVNMLTEEQTKRREELRKIWDGQYKDWKKKNGNEDFEKYKIFRRLPECVVVYEELHKLNKIKNTKEDIQITGHIDMLLWNTIHLDTENELQKILERTFKICS
jgi:hypothetical protein